MPELLQAHLLPMPTEPKIDADSPKPAFVKIGDA